MRLEFPREWLEKGLFAIHSNVPINEQGADVLTKRTKKSSVFDSVNYVLARWV